MSPHRGTSDRASSSASPAMTMPGIRNVIPPPLPPPKHLPDLISGSDHGWQWANDPSSAEYGRPATVKSGSSLLGSSERIVHKRSGSGNSGTEESFLFDNRFHSERRLEQTTFQGSSQAYDKQLLSRIGGPSTPRRQSVTGSPALDASLPPHDLERRGSQLRMQPIVEQELGRDRRLPSVSSSTGGYKRNGAVDGHQEQAMFAQDDDIPMDGASNYDRSPSSSEDLLTSRPGAKRRASSPPHDGYRDEDHLSPRRQPQVHDFRNHAPLSSASSLSGRGPGSLVSSLGVGSTASSATSYASGVLSPPTVIASDDSKAMSYPVRSLPQRQNESETHDSILAAADKQKSSPRSSISHGTFVCECCPKKPKRFETAADLKAHEAEKQYSCLYCSNRFKNKNEAERHQTSLHLRPNSWSCAALTKPESAFHASVSGNGSDVCGFCGQAYPNPADWVERTAHLEQAHKFGQCNLAKKFFRADHFRQHLKHSHDGTSGKWTNMLESACMKDEPAPPQLGSVNAVLSDVQTTAQHAISSTENLRQ